MRISDWSSDVCSSDLAWTLDLGDDEPHCRAVKVTGVGRVLTRLGPAGMAGRDPPYQRVNRCEANASFQSPASSGTSAPRPRRCSLTPSAAANPTYPTPTHAVSPHTSSPSPPHPPST